MHARHVVAPMLAVAFAAGCAESPTEADNSPATIETAGLASFVATSAEVRATPPLGGAIIPGAVAELKRFPNGVNFKLKTNGLVPGDAYTLWVGVFNNPADCNVPFDCNPGDDSNPAARSDLFHGAGHVVEEAERPRSRATSRREPRGVSAPAWSTCSERRSI